MSQWLSEFDLLDGNIEVQVLSIFKLDIRVVEQSVFSVIWSLPHILAVEFVYPSALTSQAFKDVKPCLSIHQAEASNEIQFSILSLFL